MNLRIFNQSKRITPQPAHNSKEYVVNRLQRARNVGCINLNTKQIVTTGHVPYITIPHAIRYFVYLTDGKMPNALDSMYPWLGLKPLRLCLSQVLATPCALAIAEFKPLLKLETLRTIRW